jgi:serine protease DegQ
VNGKAVSDSSVMLNLIAALPPGEVGAITVVRSQAEKVVKIKVGKRPKPSPQELDQNAME